MGSSLPHGELSSCPHGLSHGKGFSPQRADRGLLCFLPLVRDPSRGLSKLDAPAPPPPTVTATESRLGHTLGTTRHVPASYRCPSAVFHLKGLKSEVATCVAPLFPPPGVGTPSSSCVQHGPWRFCAGAHPRSDKGWTGQAQRSPAPLNPENMHGVATRAGCGTLQIEPGPTCAQALQQVDQRPQLPQTSTGCSPAAGVNGWDSAVPTQCCAPAARHSADGRFRCRRHSRA